MPENKTLREMWDDFLTLPRDKNWNDNLINLAAMDNLPADLAKEIANKLYETTATMTTNQRLEALVVIIIHHAELSEKAWADFRQIDMNPATYTQFAAKHLLKYMFTREDLEKFGDKVGEASAVIKDRIVDLFNQGKAAVHKMTAPPTRSDEIFAAMKNASRK